MTAYCTCERLQGVAPPTESTVRIIALALAGMFTGVLSIFAGQHTLIILRNKTQVEDIVSVANQRGRWIFDIGRAANWRQVMGPHWWQWVLPVAFRSVACNVPRRGHRQPLTLWSVVWCGRPAGRGLQRNGRDQLPQQRRACARGRLGRVEPAPAPCRRRCRRRERRRRSQDCVNNEERKGPRACQKWRRANGGQPGSQPLNLGLSISWGCDADALHGQQRLGGNGEDRTASRTQKNVAARVCVYVRVCIVGGGAGDGYWT